VKTIFENTASIIYLPPPPTMRTI